jgi:hypothetical protein
MVYLYDACDPIRFLLPVCRFCGFLYTFNIHLYMHIFSRIFLSNYWWQESDIWSQASYRYAILWEAFLNPSDSYFLFAEERIRFLSSIVAEKNAMKNEHICSMCIKINKVGKQEVGIWWVQKRFPRDIWSQTSYRYTILWVAFLDPSDSYFLFADLVGFYTHWTYKYGIPIWCLWPNIRFLPSTVTEKNATKTILDGQKEGQTDRGKTVYPPPLRGAGV